MAKAILLVLKNTISKVFMSKQDFESLFTGPIFELILYFEGQ